MSGGVRILGLSRGYRASVWILMFAVKGSIASGAIAVMPQVSFEFRVSGFTDWGWGLQSTMYLGLRVCLGRL